MQIYLILIYLYFKEHLKLKIHHPEAISLIKEILNTTRTMEKLLVFHLLLVENTYYKNTLSFIYCKELLNKKNSLQYKTAGFFISQLDPVIAEMNAF